MGLKDRVANAAPEWILRPVRPIYYGVSGPIYRVAHDRGWIGLEDIYDEEYYAKRQENPWRSDAHEVASAIDDRFAPESVVDFGCAIGAHLEYFRERGRTIHGVDGNPTAFEHAVVPTEYLTEHDLRELYEPARSYDLAICFEVAEHLPESAAATLVDTLTESGSPVVMTAAQPGQYGTHHVNEQPREYWIELFETRGFCYDAEAVTALRTAMDVQKTTWIPENLFVFVEEDS